MWKIEVLLEFFEYELVSYHSSFERELPMLRSFFELELSQVKSTNICDTNQFITDLLVRFCFISIWFLLLFSCFCFCLEVTYWLYIRKDKDNGKTTEWEHTWNWSTSPRPILFLLSDMNIYRLNLPLGRAR